MAAPLPVLPAPAGAGRRAYREVRPRPATNRADKTGASRRVSAKIALRFVEALDRIADTLFALLLPQSDFRDETRLMRIIQKVSQLAGKPAG